MRRRYEEQSSGGGGAQVGLGDILGLYQMMGPQAQGQQQFQQAQTAQLLQQLQLNPEKLQLEQQRREGEVASREGMANAALLRAQAAQEQTQGRDQRGMMDLNRYQGDVQKGSAMDLADAHAVAQGGDAGLQAREKERTGEAWNQGKDFKGTNLAGPEYQQWVFSHYGTPDWNTPAFQPHVEAMKKLYPHVFGQSSSNDSSSFTPSTHTATPEELPQYVYHPGVNPINPNVSTQPKAPPVDVNQLQQFLTNYKPKK